MTGKVKWFDQEKGFGFITSAERGDVFVHHSAITDQRGRRNLSEGQQVEFRVEEGDRGPKAVDVRSLRETPTDCPSTQPATHNP